MQSLRSIVLLWSVLRDVYLAFEYADKQMIAMNVWSVLESNNRKNTSLWVIKSKANSHERDSKWHAFYCILFRLRVEGIIHEFCKPSKRQHKYSWPAKINYKNWDVNKRRVAVSYGLTEKLTVSSVTAHNTYCTDSIFWANNNHAISTFGQGFSKFFFIYSQVGVLTDKDSLLKIISCSSATTFCECKSWKKEFLPFAILSLVIVCKITFFFFISKLFLESGKFMILGATWNDGTLVKLKRT